MQILDIKNTVIEMNITLNELHSRLDSVEERISDLQCRSIPTSQIEKNQNNDIREKRIITKDAIYVRPESSSSINIGSQHILSTTKTKNKQK